MGNGIRSSREERAARQVRWRNTERSLQVRAGHREAKGYFIVEALVCCLIIGILSAGLFDGYAKIRSMSVHSQTQLQAVAMGQECIDQLRAQRFDFLLANLGQHNITVVGAGNTGDAVFPRPLLRDTGLTFYQNTALQVDDTQNYLKVDNNQVSVNLTAGNNGTINADITINWGDGAGKHQYILSSVLAAAGLAG